MTIPQRKLEQQLLAALAANLTDPRLEENRVQAFLDQLKARLDAQTRRVGEAASLDSQLKEELAHLNKEQANLVDAIARHGLSEGLSARLTSVENRISQIQRLCDAGVELKVPEFTIEEVGEFLGRKTQEFANILAGNAETSRTQLQKRITKLVLTPKQTPGGPVFEVTGDINLFQGNDDVMLTNSLVVIREERFSTPHRPAIVPLQGKIEKPLHAPRDCEDPGTRIPIDDSFPVTIPAKLQNCQESLPLGVECGSKTVLVTALCPFHRSRRGGTDLLNARHDDLSLDHTSRDGWHAGGAAYSAVQWAGSAFLRILVEALLPPNPRTKMRPRT